MFSIFGSIYAFSFIIGSNWDYRLIFLVPTLPFAIERGNTDLLVFSLIFLGLMSSSKHLRWGTFFLSALLKICDIHNVPLATNPATAQIILEELARQIGV